MNKKHTIAISAIIIIFCMIWAINFRLDPVSLPTTDIWAENTVRNNIQSQMLNEVNKQNPLLPQENKVQLAQEQTNQYIKTNQVAIDQQIEQLSNQFKAEFQDENGQTYLLAIDSYYYYRFYRNIIETGHPGEYQEDGREYSNLMVAPSKMDVTHTKKDFHVYFSVWIYKFTSFFNKDLNPLTLFFLIPVIFASLSVIPAFLVGKEVGGIFGGLVAATYIPLHMSVISRTPAGFADTDVYNIFFPLLIIYFMIRAFKSKSTKQEIIWTLITTLTLTIYSTAWSGWWYSLAFVGLAYGVKWITKLAICLKESGNLNKIEHWMHQDTYGLITFIASLLTFIWIIGGNVIAIILLPLRFISASTIQNAAKANLWPNVYTTVAELNPGNWNSVLNAFGNGLGTQVGQLFLVFIVAGIVLIFFNKEDKLEYRIAKMALLVAWSVATVYATMKGTRFLLMLTIPAGISLAAFFGIGAKKIAEMSDKILEVPKKYVYPIIIILCVLILIGSKPIIGAGYNGIFVEKADQIGVSQVPSMNDAWYNTLTQIKENSNETAIISSWWDFGHQFITIARRGATADGAHQNTPQAHWLGKLLLSNDTKESTGILRMLNCDANTAFEKIENITEETTETIDILDVVNKLTKEEASEYLLTKFNQEQTENILESTHCNAPESFLVTSEDMACMVNGNRCSGKTGVWAHFGGWDFKKAKTWDIVSSNPNKLAEEKLMEAGLATTDTARNIVNELKTFDQNRADAWISGFPGYLTPMSSCTNNNGSLQCSNGAQINLNTLDARIPTQEGVISPESIVYIDSDGNYQVEKKSGTDIAIILKQSGNSYQAMYASPSIAKSTFSRLFYLENGGEMFDKFSDVRDVTGQRIIVWKVNWEN